VMFPEGRHIMPVFKTPSILWKERDMPRHKDYHHLCLLRLLFGKMYY